jgi:hypothetical protein
MQLHNDQIFDDNVAITATRDSTNRMMISGALGTGTFNNKNTDGNEIIINVDITQVFATLTSLTIGVYGSADDVTYDTVPLVQTGAIPVARLLAGSRFQLILPANIPAGYSIPKYIKVTYTVGGSSATTGKVESYIASVRQATA